MKRSLILSAALASLFMVGCVDREAQKQAKETEAIVSDPAVLVSVQAAQTQDVEDAITISGSITTEEDTQIGAKISGRLVSVLVQDGSQVTAGQVIAVQETATLQTQLRQAMGQLGAAQANLAQAQRSAAVRPTQSSAGVAQAEAQLNQANAQLRSARAQLAKARAGARVEERRQAESAVNAAKSNLDTAQKDLDRTRNLVEQGALAQARLDAALNVYSGALNQYQNALQALEIIRSGARSEDLEVAQEAVRQAEAGVRSAQEGVRNAKAQKELDGTANDQVMAARSQVQSAQASIDQINQSIADATIRSPFSGRISGKPAPVGTVLGPGATVARLVGGDGSYFEAEVPETAIPKVSPGQDITVKVSAFPDRTFAGRVASINPAGTSVGRLFRVRIAFLGNSSDLKPGMFATASLSLAKSAQAVVVPFTSVVKRDAGDVVYVVEGSDTLREVPVKTGIRVGELIQVTGVSSGAQVVVRGQTSLSAESKIKLSTDSSAAESAEKGA